MKCQKEAHQGYRAGKVPAFKPLSMLFILLVAFPFRIRHAFFIFNSISIFDIALVGFGILLLLCVLLREGRLYIGNKVITFLLCVPLGIGLLSLAWSWDISKTAYYLIALTEAILSYLVIVNLLRSYKASPIMRLVAILVILIISTSFLSYFHVPGFAPSIEPGAAAYASYYTRLGSPFIGPSNAWATTIAYFFFFSWAWYSVSHRRSYMALSIIILSSIIMTVSKGVLLSVILTVPLFISWQKIKLRKLITPILVVILLSILGFTAAFHFGEQFRTYYPSVFSIHHAWFVSLAVRVQRAGLALAKLSQSPFLGYGAQVLPFLGSVHNTYIENLLYFGLPLGLFVDLSLLGLPLAFIRRSRRGSGITSRICLGIAIAIITQLMIFTVEASYEGQFLRILFYISIGFSVALVNSLERPERTVRREYGCFPNAAA